MTHAEKGSMSITAIFIMVIVEVLFVALMMGLSSYLAKKGKQGSWFPAVILPIVVVIGWPILMKLGILPLVETTLADVLTDPSPLDNLDPQMQAWGMAPQDNIWAMLGMSCIVNPILSIVFFRYHHRERNQKLGS